ncbi:MAG TPA: CPBP family intramembrane glutamic endopeptidase [Steroidobacteraceae bacterium]|nr:CPBP family intramembrane glutamic endopeptidase [Steroidobacteraceae bacterium]
MRNFSLFVALMALALIAAAAFTYPAWWLVSLVSVEPVHRVMNRLAMLFALVGLILLTRKLGLADRDALGYGLPRRRFLSQLFTAWVIGFALMSPLIVMLLGLDIRELRSGGAGSVAQAIPGALVSGLAVAFIEETFFRGALFTAVSRQSGKLAAIIAPSLLYAAVHFLGGKLSLAAHQVSWEDGFVVLSRLFERYADPLALADSFTALFALGIFLAVVRARTGAIAATIGLHAAGVTTIALLRDQTRVERGSEYAFLVGSYDGVIGWAAAIWFVVIVAGFIWLSSKRRADKAELGAGGA